MLNREVNAGIEAAKTILAQHLSSFQLGFVSDDAIRDAVIAILQAAEEERSKSG